MIYLIKRGPSPSYMHADIQYHQYVICTKKSVADREAGWSGDNAWIWGRPNDEYSGWLLLRWNGLNIDYGHIVRVFTLPDGTKSAFRHNPASEPWTLLSSAIWWSSKKMPKWFANFGVQYPSDYFTQQRILDTEADDGCSGFGRRIPAHWPQDPNAPVRDGRSALQAAGFVRAVEGIFKRVEDNFVHTEIGGTHYCQVLPDRAHNVTPR